MGSSKDGLQVGNMVEIDIQLPGHTVMRHSSSVRSGFEFMGLTPEERAPISAIMSNS